MDKAALREKMIARRLAMEAAEVERRSRQIIDRIMALSAFQEAGLVFSYVAFRREVETRGLIQAALAAGKRVAVPLVDRANRRLLALEITGFGDLAPGIWGIPEPRAEVCRPVELAAIDLAIVPGVAFDRCGNRLGYGGGYYDRFLPALPAGAPTVAPAYGFQVVAELPVGPGDVPVRYVVTEEEIICCRRSERGGD